MKRYTSARTLLLLFFALLLNFASCKKGQKEPVVENTVTLDKSAVLPGDVVTVSTNFSISATASTITIGTKQTSLVRTEDKKAMFVVPVLASGQYTLDFSSLGAKTVSLTISAYQPITNPQAVFDQFRSDATAAMAVMESLKNDPVSPLPESEYTFMADLNTQLNAIYTTLSVEDKLQAAYTLQRLSFVKVDMTTLDDTKGFFSLAAAQTGYKTLAGPKSTNDADYADPAESLVKTGKKFIGSMSFTVASVGIGVLALQAPEPSGLSKLIAVAAGMTAGYHLSQSLALIDRIFNLIGMPSAINDPVFTSTNSSTIGVNSKSVQSLVSTTAASGLTLYNNNPVNLSVTSKFRTLSKADASSANDFVKSVFQGEQQMASMYNALQSGFNKVKSWFSGKAPVLSGYTSKLKTTSAEKDYYLPAGALTVNNVSDASVTLTAVPKDNKLVLTATSSTGTAEKPVAFDLTYTNATLGTTVKKTISATYDPRVTLLGTWYLKQSVFTNRYGGGNIVMESGQNFTPVGSWTFNSNGTVSLFESSPQNWGWKFTSATNSGGTFTLATLGFFIGSKAYTLSNDKQFVTIPWSPFPGPYSTSTLPSQNLIEILTLTSSSLALRFAQHDSGASSATQWGEVITVTFSRQP